MLYCYNLLIVAYGAIANTSAVIFYLKEIDKDNVIIPEQLKDIQFEIELNIKAIEDLMNNWYD